MKFQQHIVRCGNLEPSMESSVLFWAPSLTKPCACCRCQHPHGLLEPGLNTSRDNTQSLPPRLRSISISCFPLAKTISLLMEEITKITNKTISYIRKSLYLSQECQPYSLPGPSSPRLSNPVYPFVTFIHQPISTIWPLFTHTKHYFFYHDLQLAQSGAETAEVWLDSAMRCAGWRWNWMTIDINTTHGW